MRQKLISRFRQLWILELVNAFVIFPLLVYTISRNFGLGRFAVLGTVLVGLMLVVGAAFGYLKYRDLRDGTENLSRYEKLFHWLRRLIPALLALVFLFGLTQMPSITSGNQVPDFLLGAFLSGFAVLEYINYFHTQLMYDNQRDIAHLREKKKLKRGLIAREFGW